MTLIQTFHGNATNGTELTAVYAEQPAANVAFALVFPGNDLPRLVHWGRPLAVPATVIDMFDAQMPQRVSGALDYTPWPSVLPTQSESWIGATRFDVRRDGVELFCKFAVSNITAETVAAGKTYVMGEKDGYPSWSVADEPKQTPTEQHVKLIWTCELDETGLIRQNAEVVNTGEGQLEVGKIELAFTVPADANEILTTTGHHLRERSPQRQDFTLGRFAKASMAGRPDFDATLLLSVGEKGFGFTHGNVYSAHVAWSGNSVLSAERLPYTSGVIGGGEVLFGGEISLANGESYTTPWLIGSYGEGLNEVAARFHGYIRRVHRDWLVEHNIATRGKPSTSTTITTPSPHSPTRPWKVAWNVSWWMTAGSAPAATTPPALATGRSRKTCGPTATSHSRHSPIMCMARDSNSACGSSRKWSTWIPTCSARIPTGC